MLVNPCCSKTVVMRYKYAMGGTEPTIVILPGWGHGRESWTDFFGRFEDATTLELPGFGSEPLISNTWSVPEYADWVRGKVVNMGTTNVILLGHSFGGRVASLLASERPEWLRGLILYGAPCIYRPTLSVRLEIALARIVKTLGLAKLLEQFRNADLKQADERGIGTIFRRTVGFDQTAMLPHIEAPTLLLWGEYDDSAPVRLAYEMKTLVPNARLSILPGLGHNAHIENPTLFYGTVKRFLENS